MKSIGGWHINAADASWRKRLVGYKAKFGSTTNMDLILPYRTMDVLAAAINTAGTAEPTKVALALEGMKYNGFTGPTWSRGLRGRVGFARCVRRAWNPTLSEEASASPQILVNLYPRKNVLSNTSIDGSQ